MPIPPCVVHPVALLRWVVAVVHHVAVAAPMHKLYFQGPTMHGYGFWGGAAPEDICAAVSNTSALFWMGHPGQCELVLLQHFTAFLVAVEVAGYVYAAYRMVSWASTQYFIVRPAIAKLDRFVAALERGGGVGRTNDDAAAADAKRITPLSKIFVKSWT